MNRLKHIYSYTFHAVILRRTTKQTKKFFYALLEEIKKLENNSTLYVMGHFNGRWKSGHKQTRIQTISLVHMLQTTMKKIIIGKRILDLCSQQHLCIANQLLNYIDPQRYTWYKWNYVNVNSQNDYILNKSERKIQNLLS